MIFQAPQNFKKGRYILNRYRPSDALIIIGTLLITILAIISYLNIFKNNSILVNLLFFLIMILPILVVYILFTPLPTYFNVLDFIKSFLNFQQKQKRWKWEGIHQFDDEDIMEVNVQNEQED